MFSLINFITHDVSIGVGSVNSAGLASHPDISFQSPFVTPRVSDDPVALWVVTVPDSNDGMKSERTSATFIDSTSIVQEGFWNIEGNCDWSTLKAGLHLLNTDTFGIGRASADMGTLPVTSIYAASRATKVLGSVWEASFANKTSNS